MTEERAVSVIGSNASLRHRIRVLVVDDYAAVRHAVAAVLAAFPDLELAGQASSTEEAVRLCECTDPDVILMDVTLPGIDGAAAIRAILDCYPSSRVIATCTFQEEDLIPEALSAGAVGYLLKNVSADELASTIRAAYAAPSAHAHASSDESRRDRHTHLSQPAPRASGGSLRPIRRTI